MLIFKGEKYFALPVIIFVPETYQLFITESRFPILVVVVGPIVNVG
jgi:hypothetical protein